MKPSADTDKTYINSQELPTTGMALLSHLSSVDSALGKIRQQFIQRLDSMYGQQISFVNDHDATTPPLRFEFISACSTGKGVYRQGEDSQTGCTQCRPDMGQQIGCEYTQRCDCLEYAAPDRSRLSKAQLEKLEIDSDTTGLPKRFPYQKGGLLINQYLDDRFPIYECNRKCGCGPQCKTRLVQRGRTVKLEIFKTEDRGWGKFATCLHA